jgi:hypothetical protein
MSATTKASCLIRMPAELKERLTERAVVEHRSLNMQIVKILQDGLDDDAQRVASALREALRK